MFTYLTLVQLISPSPLQFTGRDKAFKDFKEASEQGAYLSNKFLGRSIVACAAAPGYGKSTFFEQLLSRASLLMDSPVVPMSATFNFQTDHSTAIEGKINDAHFDVVMSLLCRLVYKWVILFYSFNNQIKHHYSASYMEKPTIIPRLFHSSVMLHFSTRTLM